MRNVCMPTTIRRQPAAPTSSLRRGSCSSPAAAVPRPLVYETHSFHDPPGTNPPNRAAVKKIHTIRYLPGSTWLLAARNEPEHGSLRMGGQDTAAALHASRGSARPEIFWLLHSLPCSLRVFRVFTYVHTARLSLSFSHALLDLARSRST